jgi:hypothetical protein
MQNAALLGDLVPAIPADRLPFPPGPPVNDDPPPPPPSPPGSWQSAAMKPPWPGMTTNWRRYRSRKVTGPRGPGTLSMLIPVSGTDSSLNPSSRRVVAFQNAPVPAYAPRNSAAAPSSRVTIAAASPDVCSLAIAAASRGPSAGAIVTVAATR